MKTDKQKAIEKAYGEHWDAVKIFTDMSTGWCNHPNSEFGRLGLSPEDKERFKIIHNIAKKEDWQNDQFYFRPKSLKGIENNNGWIRIEIESDLPTEYASYFVRYNDGSIIVHHFSPNSDFDKILFMEEFTHYQPVSIPKSPIY